MPPWFDPIQAEIVAVSSTQDVVSRLRVMAVDGLHEGDPLADTIHDKAARAIEGFQSGIDVVIEAIVHEKGFRCAVKGEVESWDAPVRLAWTDVWYSPDRENTPANIGQMCWVVVQSCLGKALASLSPPKQPGEVPVFVSNPWPANWFLQ